MHLTHTEVVEYRQRISKLNMARGKAQEEEIGLRRWLQGIEGKYQIQGLRNQIDADTGEIKVFPEVVHYEPWQSAFHAEKAAEGRNIWTEELPVEEPLAQPPEIAVAVEAKT